MKFLLLTIQCFHSTYTGCVLWVEKNVVEKYRKQLSRFITWRRSLYYFQCRYEHKLDRLERVDRIQSYRYISMISTTNYLAFIFLLQHVFLKHFRSLYPSIRKSTRQEKLKSTNDFQFSKYKKVLNKKFRTLNFTFVWDYEKERARRVGIHIMHEEEEKRRMFGWKIFGAHVEISKRDLFEPRGRTGLDSSPEGGEYRKLAPFPIYGALWKIRAPCFAHCP